jgi:acyl-CoA thioester hydrolase
MKKKFIWPIRIYYEDTDAGGVVFYANYLKFYERARTEMLRSMGYQQDELIDLDNAIFVVRSVKVDYLKPAKFNEILDVSATVDSVGAASVTFDQDIRCDEMLISQAHIKIACLDAETMRPKVIPEKLLEHFKHEC